MNSKVRIDRIIVKKLFGMYSYSLITNPDSNFMIMYGDNGSGKTTILNILYHLLNPERNGRHRFQIGSIPFLSFSVALSNSITITAERESIDEAKYSIVFPYNEGTLKYIWDREADSSYNNSENTFVYDCYCRLLDEINLNTLFVSSNRRIYEEDDEKNQRLRLVTKRHSYSNEADNNAAITLKEVIDSFNTWMHYSVFTLTNEGNQSIDDHYLKIIKNYMQRKEISNANIKKKITEIKEKNKAFVEFGLSIDFFSDKFQKTIEKLTESELEQVAPALDSYVGSLELRLNALKPLLVKLQHFRNYISSMLRDKKVIIDAYQGVHIYNNQNRELDLQNLSSGEKQIMYLFCKIVTSSDNSMVVLIDEPEISLNVKWQRLFLKAVESLIGVNETQVIIASHSIELISPYADSIVMLKES